MQPDLIREIAETIVRDEFLLNWRLYAAIGAVSLIAGATGNWLGSYMKKRGETFATRADAEEILRQLAASTRATEEVRSTIAQADWAAREWRKTRRLKLEQLLASVYSLDHWLDLQRTQWIHGEKTSVTAASPMARLKLLATLYFPELQTEATAVWMTHHDIYRLFLEIGMRTQPARNDNDAAALQKSLDDLFSGFQPRYEAAHRALLGLEKRASQLMAEIAGT